MKFIKEYRDPQLIHQYVERIRHMPTQEWKIMEICGGQTHTIVKFGIDALLPRDVSLIHGPGCPVCVTPVELIDKALMIAAHKEVIFCSFGDMLRVPGSLEDLFAVKSQGGDIRIVYSPMDALELAKKNPQKQVVFFAVGFETTAPANAMAVYQAAQQKIENFSILVSHVLVPPAIEALMASEATRIDGFLAAGHVCTIMGYSEYEPLATNYQVPIVVTGFEPLDILQGVWMCLQQLESGQYQVQNQYARSVRKDGNVTAQRLMREVFQVVPRQWRGIGEIPRSGLGLAPAYAAWDAETRFGLQSLQIQEASQCESGLILQGIKKPLECPEFGTRCLPEKPLGAPMVSAEGACAAYYRYRQQVHA